MRKVPVLALLLVASACTEQAADLAADGDRPTWRALPPAPLSAREHPHVVVFDELVLVVGGSDSEPCPPAGDCATPNEPLRDGARFDVESRRWDRIADPPVPILSAISARIGDSVYLSVVAGGHAAARRALLEYRPKEDRWREHELPPNPDLGYSLAATDHELIAFLQSHEVRRGPDYAFDLEEQTWREVPADPLAPSFDRAMVWTGRELVLLTKDLVPSPGSEEPSLARAAALDPKTRRWRSFDTSETLASQEWFWAGERVVHLMLGSADGGGVNGWGRSYPQGGMLDPKTGEWSDLPDPPEASDRFYPLLSGGDRVTCCGWVLDVSTKRWTPIPDLPEPQVERHGAAIAGDELIVWGGSVFPDGDDGRGKLSNEGWSLRLD